MHTGEGSAQSIRTQSYMGWKDSIKREETVTMVTGDWLHTGRLIKCVTPHTGLSPMWTHSSSCLGLASCLCAQLSCFAPPTGFRTELLKEYLLKEKANEKEKRHSVLFSGLFLFVCYLFLKHCQYSLTSCLYLLSSFSTL